MLRRAALMVTIFVVGLSCPSRTLASETIVYTYDARGRLIKVVVDRPSGPTNDVQACYKYDKADNRTKVKVDVGSQPACP